MLYSSVLLFPASKMLYKPKQRRQRNRDLSRTSSFSSEKQKSGTCVIPKFRVTQSRDVESVGPDAMMRPTGFPEWGLCQFSPCCDMGENFSLSLTHSLSLSPYFRHKRGFSFCTVTEYKRGQLRYFFSVESFDFFESESLWPC